MRWLGAGERRCKDRLLTSSGIVPKRVDKEVIYGKSLVIAKELKTISIKRSADIGIPTLRRNPYIR